jgi:hypothetical protein
MMQLGRALRHLFSTRWGTRRRFTVEVRRRIEAAIAGLERRHAGEIRFAIETALDLPELWDGVMSRERAVNVFGQLGVWDTAGNNGVLIYVLDGGPGRRDRRGPRDRGARRPGRMGRAVPCHGSPLQGRAASPKDRKRGSPGVGALLARHFPGQGGDANEQPDRPVLL